jgi:cytochrome c oxidase assembly factor CtaG
MPTVVDLATDWSLEPALLLSAAVVLGAYVWGARRADWPAWRTACFAAGVAATVAALCSGLDGWAERLLSVHMAQHLVLVLVAAPLLVAGAPVALALRALPRDDARRLAAALRSRPARLLTDPLVTWPLFVATTLATHLTGFYDAALRHPPLHAAEHLLYLTTALLFWLPALGSEPLARRLGFVGRLLYVLTAMPAMAVVGIALTDGETVRYPAYLEPARALGVSALADQHAAGMLMWAGGATVAALLTIAAAWSALVQEERRQQARERREAPGGSPRAPAPAPPRARAGAAAPGGPR